MGDIGVDSIRKAVNISYVLGDDSELARVFATNVETGGISNSNWSKNDGYAVLTYPLDYEGQTLITVQGNHGGTAEGGIAVTADGAEPLDLDASAEHPIELPDEELPEGPEDVPHPEHPIELPVVEHH